MGANKPWKTGAIQAGHGNAQTLYINVYWREHGLSYSVFRSRAEADDSSSVERVACVSVPWKMEQYDA